MEQTEGVKTLLGDPKKAKKLQTEGRVSREVALLPRQCVPGNYSKTETLFH